MRYAITCDQVTHFEDNIDNAWKYARNLASSSATELIKTTAIHRNVPVSIFDIQIGSYVGFVTSDHYGTILHQPFHGDLGTMEDEAREMHVPSYYYEENDLAAYDE